MTTTEIRKYTVLGMSCGHCRSSVLEEVSGIEGVEKAEVDLNEGVLEIHGSNVDDDLVSAAVVDAGYQIGQVG